MAWGLFKKVVIADRLAIVVDRVYSTPQDYNSLSLIIATFFYSFQIFCDFSGYSDMAIGAARIMGFKLMKNFDRPYHAKNVNEFWKRWHISLSSWFKDYLYISIGGNRVTIPRWYLNLFIVFLISGLWHGANWTFIIWGALHGLYLVFGIISNRFRMKLNSFFYIDKIPIIKIFTTFALVTFAWIFFRAKDINSAFYIISHMFSGIPDLFGDIKNHQPVLQALGPLKRGMLLIVLLETIHFVQSRVSITSVFIKQPGIIRWGFYFVFIYFIIFWGVFENRPFIYFQF